MELPTQQQLESMSKEEVDEYIKMMTEYINPEAYYIHKNIERSKEEINKLADKCEALGLKVR